MNKKQYKLGDGLQSWMGGRAHDITFIVTEDCNLRCKYCYQVHKNNNNKLDFEIAKKAIDYILERRDLFSAKAVTWEFIGGEPLLEMELIDKITDYIKIQTFKKDHPWFSMFRLNFSTNGTLYADKKVRRYIAKNWDKCNFGITIDGIKEKHDLQRIYTDGRGSYDDVVKNIPLWIEEFQHVATKVTFGSEDLKYLKDSIIHLWNLGIEIVPANVVFEDVWNEGDDVIFENQLKDLADYIIDNKLWNKYHTTLFDDSLGTPLKEQTKNQNRCGAGMMLAIDGKGNYYPCLRYSAYSLESSNGYAIGNVDDGLDFDKIRPFIGLTLASQSDEECLNCEIAEGCSWCQGHCYDCTKGETNYKRAKYICKMHKARYRANEYYWSRLRDEFTITRELREPKSKYLYFIMDDNCVEHCNYESSSTSNLMSEEIIKKGFKFAEKNFFTPIILNSKDNVKNSNLNTYSYYDRIELYSNSNDVPKNNHKKFQVITSKTINEKVASESCLLSLESFEIKNLYEYTKKLFETCNRVNLNIKYNDRDFPIKEYKEQLTRISNLIFETYKVTGKVKEFNKITDDLYNVKMDNCNAGEKSYALAPNGKIYPCPKFYFEDKNSYIGDIDSEVLDKGSKIFELEKAPICSGCDIYHCDRCIYLNKKFTNEYNTPSNIQCKISLVEKSITYDLSMKFKSSGFNLFPKEISGTFEDPINLLLKDKVIKPYALDVYTKSLDYKNI